jgi:hypothetical protein
LREPHKMGVCSEPAPYPTSASVNPSPKTKPVSPCGCTSLLRDAKPVGAALCGRPRFLGAEVSAGCHGEHPLQNELSDCGLLRLSAPTRLIHLSLIAVRKLSEIFQRFGKISRRLCVYDQIRFEAVGSTVASNKTKRRQKTMTFKRSRFSGLSRSLTRASGQNNELLPPQGEHAWET